MPKTFSDSQYIEQIRIVCRLDDPEALTKAACRVADLTLKKGYVIADTYVEDNNQNFYLESKKAPA